MRRMRCHAEPRLRRALRHMRRQLSRDAAMPREMADYAAADDALFCFL